MTPEQMRALAVRMARRRSVTAFETEIIAALRAAADQLEAVQKVCDEIPMTFAIRVALTDALAGPFPADTALQEDRDE